MYCIIQLTRTGRFYTHLLLSVQIHSPSWVRCSFMQVSSGQSCQQYNIQNHAHINLGYVHVTLFFLLLISFNVSVLTIAWDSQIMADVVICCHSSSTSPFCVWCVLRCFSILFDSIWVFSSDLTYQKSASTHRTVTHLMWIVFAPYCGDSKDCCV